MSTTPRIPVCPASRARWRGEHRRRYLERLNWYLEHLGPIVSDFPYYLGQRALGRS